MSHEPSPFLFADDSEMVRVNRERCGLIFGPAAAILQIAHPRIAQGVYDHSNFRSDALGRLQRTLRGTNRIAFGRVSKAEAIKERLAAVHRTVRGDVSPGMAGGPYSAFEPDLLRWVLATLIEAAVRGYEFIYGNGSLSLARKESFYRDMCRFGSFFGLKETECPDTWAAFQVYYREMIDGDLLGSHPICAELAHAIVAPRDSPGIRALGWATNFLPVETMPKNVRERLGLRSTVWTRVRMGTTRKLLPKLWPHLPARMRFHPEYLERAQDSQVAK